MIFKKFIKILLFLTLVLSGRINSQVCGGSFGAPIFNEDFGSVTTPLQMISPALVPPAFTNYIYSPRMPPNDGYYTITNSSQYDNWGWQNSLDHTNDASGTYGNMLLVNASYTPGEFYRRRVSNLCSNQVYRFSAWILNIHRAGANLIKPNVTFQIRSTTGTVLGSVSTGDLREENGEFWRNFYLDFKSDPSSTEVDVVLINNSPGGIGNDLAIDDISFSPCGPATSVSTSIDVFTKGVCDNSLGFQLSAQISAGTYTTPNYIWQKSTDGGNTWVDLTSATTNPTINIPANSYQNNDLYRFIVGESTNISSPTCRVYSSNYRALVHGYPMPPISKTFNFCQYSTGNSLEISGKEILWYTSATGGIPDALPPIVDTSVVSSKDYWVTETVNGCQSSRTKITVNILQNPSAPLVSNYQFCKDSNAAALTAIGSNLLWYSSITGGIGNTTAPIPNTSVPGIFSFWVSQNNGTCESTRAEIKVTILEVPHSNTLINQSICDGQTVVLDAGSGFVNYEWSTNPMQFTQKISVSSPGVYTVKLTDSNGCTALQSVEVVAGVTPNITNIKTGEDFLEVFAENGNPPYLYSLDNISWQTSNVFTNLTSGIYEVFVKSQTNSCTAIAKSAVLFIPNVITPNQDGINDFWSVKNLEYFSKAKLSIYDRFGKKVFQADDVSKFNWDGFHLGRVLPSDTYWYVLEIENNNTRKGWILLKTRN